MGCFCRYCPCQEVCPSFTEKDIQRGTKNRDLDAMRRDQIQEEGVTVIERWKCEWWRLYKTNNAVIQHIRYKFSYKRSVTDFQLLDAIEKSTSFG